jgi:hypothetical protein
MDSSDPILKVLEKQAPTNKYQVHESDMKSAPLWAIRRRVQLSRLLRKRLYKKHQRISDKGTHDESND